MAPPAAPLAPAKVRAFPWRSLDSISRAEETATRDLRRWAAHHVRLDAVERALAEILGQQISIRTRRARRLADVRAADEALAVVLSPADSPETIAGGILVEAEGGLAAALVARAIKRPPSVIVRAGEAGGPNLAGALAAIVAAVARRAYTHAPLRVTAAGRATTLAAELLRTDPGVMVLGLTVLVGNEAFLARVALSAERAERVPGPPWDVAALAALGPTPLQIPIVAASAMATVAELGALRRGDVLVLGNWPLSRTEDGWTGPVLLSPPSYDVGVQAHLGGGGHLVLGAGVEPLLAAEASMPDSDEKGLLVTAMGDIPVVVRVEIGEARMPAREWASLGRGDVVALGCRVGELVVLRVGGVPVARGELVDIEGEVGVRIVDRLHDGPTS